MRDLVPVIITLMLPEPVAAEVANAQRTWWDRLAELRDSLNRREVMLVKAECAPITVIGVTPGTLNDG